MAEISLRVTGSERKVSISPDTPLLRVRRVRLGLTGTQYGCGAGFGGACAVHGKGASTRSCAVPVSQVAGRNLTTIEGLASGSEDPHERPWIAEEVPRCGYCQSGQIMAAAPLPAKTPHRSEEQVTSFMAANLCRCGTDRRIRPEIPRVRNEGGAG